MFHKKSQEWLVPMAEDFILFWYTTNTTQLLLFTCNKTTQQQWTALAIVCSDI